VQKKMSKAEQKMAMREEAKRKIKGGGYGRGSKKSYREAVEAGRKQLQVKSSEAGDSLAKKAKNELNYLLNNYLPRYDARIEQLIDIWRRSGDPGYSASIRTKLLKARRDHMQKSNPV